MNRKKVAQKVIEDNGGIARTADFTAAGMKNYDVAELCKEGFLERIRHGVYQFPGNDQIMEEQLLRELLPQGIVCVESALFYYGYSDFVPRAWSVAVPRTASRAVSRIREFPLKAYYIQKEYFSIGRSVENFNGVELAVYDRERTICDCFKYRTKLDSETFNKALNAYVVDDQKNLANLSGYAKRMKLYAKVMNVMEVLLAPFVIDFGVGDVIVPKQEKRKIPTQLPDFRSPMVNTYSVETTVAEKLDAILSLMEFSSRMKDYYDIYYIANKFDLDGATLAEALRKTFENREHSFTVEQFDQVMGFGSDEEMQKKWKAFVRKINTKTGDYNIVLKTINNFLKRPFTMAVEGKTFTKHWSAADSGWI